MKFLCDAMHGKTARWLRILGFDTYYPTSPDVKDADLLVIASRENRILLTNDKLLYKLAQKQGIPCFFLKESSITDRICELANHFGFERILQDDLEDLTRCPACNGELRIVPVDLVKEKIPVKTQQQFNRFWVCQNDSCGKIYWKGLHWTNIRARLKEIKNKLKKSN
ncbi:MAG: Mut7-C RNAse domain-containing protein [Candidatus Helarchaeales archaeon]